MNGDIALDIQDLRVDIDTNEGTISAARGVSLQAKTGRTLAIVGESGSGKSVSMQAVLGLLDNTARVRVQGKAMYKNLDLLQLTDRALNRIRGTKITMISQNPMSSLNPTMKLGSQIAETLIVHKGMSARDAQGEACELLAKVHINDPAKRAQQYPFECSGGMLQRVMIAMALACKPDILIADEPTTALDATIQDQILSLIKENQQRDNSALILITHDLGVVARMADDVAVMYAGQIVEAGCVDDIFYQGMHPYNQGLQNSIPKNSTPDSKDSGPQRLTPIPGAPPDLLSIIRGCAFAPRCPRAMNICQRRQPPELAVSPSATNATPHYARCWLQHERAKPSNTASSLSC